MPYVRSRGYRSRAPGKPMRGRPRYPKKAKSLALKALRIARNVSKREEVKFIETECINQDLGATYPFATQNLVPVGNGGAIFCVSNMNQGTGEGQRIGEKISPTSLTYRMQLGLSGNASEGFLMRTIVFMDRQQITNPPTVPSTGNVLQNARPMSHFNRELQPRFKILHDKLTTINRENTAQRVTRFVRGYVKFPSWLQTYFTGSGGTTLMRNQIYVLQIATQNSGAIVGDTIPLGAAYLTMQVRFNYKDS